MGESGLSASDVLALDGRNNDMFNGGSMAFWIFALLFLNNGGFGMGRGDYVTGSDLANSQNQQTTQLQISGLSNQVSDTRYDLAHSIQQQTSELMINGIQGFNNLGLQIANQTNSLGNQIAQLSAKVDSCCCEIKTQMLQDRLDEAERRNVVLQNSIDNANQSQYLLGQLGRFVAWAGSGAPAATAAISG